MAQTTITGAWVDTTEQEIIAAPCRVTSITVALNQGQTAPAFLQFWDLADPTPGTDVPFMTIPIPSVAINGYKRTFKVIFPNGGLRFNVACTMFVGTDPEAITAVTTTAIPQSVRVDYALGN